eukprot:7803187-Pyramimonas_sp.AAC.1
MDDTPGGWSGSNGPGGPERGRSSGSETEWLAGAAGIRSLMPATWAWVSGFEAEVYARITLRRLLRVGGRPVATTYGFTWGRTGVNGVRKRKDSGSAPVVAFTAGVSWLSPFSPAPRQRSHSSRKGSASWLEPPRSTSASAPTKFTRAFQRGDGLPLLIGVKHRTGELCPFRPVPVRICVPLGPCFHLTILLWVDPVAPIRSRATSAVAARGAAVPQTDGFLVIWGSNGP